MRLLNATTRQLEEFVAEEIPPYAILSHTWGKAADEVKLQDLNDVNVEEKRGYQKIDYCCKQALKDGLQWVWVDTKCCIDKTSTAELSEAINSMFCWYQRSKVCYAYLADVPDLALDGLSDGLSFTSSRWFTRGWTLQELIAPQNLVFFSHNWHDIGTKKSLSSELSRITRVEQKFLTSRDLFWHLRDDSPSIAQIMSWAAERRTTRVEDRAYCLLGLFDITMPLLYGEGRKAFFRLQEELIKVSNDQSLFAWGISPGQQLRLTDFDDRHLLEAMIEHDWKLGTTGMFAQSPADFRNSGNICRLPFPVQFFPYCKAPAAIINRGFRLEMPLFNYWGPIDKSVLDSHFLQRAPPGGQLFVDIPIIEDLIFAVIACSYEGDTQNYLGIPLLSLGHKLSFREGMMVWGRCRSVILVPGEALLKKCTLIHIHSHWISDWCLPESVSPLR